MNGEDRMAFADLMNELYATRKDYPDKEQKRLMWWVYKKSRDHYRQQVQQLVKAVDRACTLYFTDLDEVECEDDVIDERDHAIDDLMALWRGNLAAKLKEQHGE